MGLPRPVLYTSYVVFLYEERHILGTVVYF